MNEWEGRESDNGPRKMRITWSGALPDHIVLGNHLFAFMKR